MWLSHLDTLVATHRVYLVDTVGDMNKSTATAVMATRGDVTRWIDSVVDALQVARGAFLGHSYGSWMAVTYGIARPDRVARLALLSPAAVFSRVRPKWIASAVYAHMMRPRTETAREFIATTYMQTTGARLNGTNFGRVIEQYVLGVPGFRGSIRDARPCTYDADAFAALTMPVLVIIGADETVCNGPRSAAKARQRLPGASIELLANAHHCSFADQSIIVDALLGKFLAS